MGLPPDVDVDEEDYPAWEQIIDDVIAAAKTDDEVDYWLARMAEMTLPPLPLERHDPLLESLEARLARTRANGGERSTLALARWWDLFADPVQATHVLAGSDEPSVLSES